MTDTIDQDLSLLAHAQKGMHSEGFRGLWLNEIECRVSHFHEQLDTADHSTRLEESMHAITLQQGLLFPDRHPLYFFNLGPLSLRSGGLWRAINRLPYRAFRLTRPSRASVILRSLSLRSC